jgi:thioredoxin 1
MVKAIKFYATWCGPCKVYSKTWDKVAQELSGEAEFIEVNIDRSEEHTSELQSH